MRGTRVLIGTAALLFSGIAAVHAQDQDPSARVARTSFLQGDVSFRPGTVDDWTSATLNYPLTSGDHLWTDVDARAELHVGANAIRLAPETAFEILDLDDNRLQIRLSQGSALITVRTLDVDDNIEIDTPTGAVSLLRDGTYRVDVSADGATSTLTARNGDAEVTSNDQTIDVRPDETVLFTADGASQDVRDAAPMDEYDEWASARDRAEDQSVSAQYVSRDMTGYEDLDRNGTWSDDPEYGHVWAPTNVAADWAPYRYGRWVWVEPYGWTWIDDAPWGFAPFHYGRWAYSRNRWVWAPGVVRSRPVYAPALVVFVGGNNNDPRWNDRGNVAWFPLAPNEVYRPAYRTSDGYVRRVNVTNVNVTNINVTNINVTNINYRNQRVNGAMTAVPQDQFEGSRRIGRNATIVPVEQARYAHVVGDGAPVAPTQQSVIIRRRNATTPVSRPPEAVQNRPVVWKNTPPPRPAPFASHADQLKATGTAPVAPLPISQTRGAPRVEATSHVSRTNAPAAVNSSTSNPAAHTVTPANTDGRRTPNTRPNVNVQRYPSAQPAQPDENVSPKAAPNGNTNNSARRAPSEQPNVNVRSAPAPTPAAAPAAVPAPRPNTNDRPTSHTDEPAPVNGSPNAGPAHTVDPNTNVRQVPRTQPAPAPRAAPGSPPNTRPVSHSDVQPNERPAPQAAPRSAAPQTEKSPEQGEKPQTNAPPRTEARPTRQGNERTASEGRRTQGDDKEKAKPEQNEKPPRHG